MSNDKTEVIPTAAPAPTRRSILHPASSPSAPAQLFADWRDAAPTELLPAMPSRRVGRRDRRVSVRRHLRAALAGTLLAIVAISGISAYAAQGIANARQAAADHARSQVSVPR
jgi:hypothetical protein